MFPNSLKCIAVACACVLVSSCAENSDDTQESGTVNAAPKIILEGSSSVTLSLNEAFVEPGFVAFDEEDGVLTSEVEYNINSVNTGIAGTYQLVYQVSDSEGLSAPIVIRTVTVVSSNSGASSSGGPLPPVEVTPVITSFELVAFTDADDMVFVQNLFDDKEVNLAEMPTPELNIVASSTDPEVQGSVHFHLEGPISYERYENHAPYIMAVEGENLDLTKDQLPPGAYTLTVTPYSKPDLAGTTGEALSLSFTVKDEVTSEPILGPAIAAVDLIAATEEGTQVTVQRVEHDSVIVMNEMPTSKINLVAVPASNEDTGSVHFKLTKAESGAQLIERYENWAIFTLADDANNLDVNTMEGGRYHLTITAYSEMDIGGEVGAPYVISFDVVPYVAPSIIAQSDTYTLDVNTPFDTGFDLSVAANDSFSTDTAIFAIVSEPTHGSVSMDITGAFYYEPSIDYTGKDQFVYEIRQGAEVATATVEIDIKPTTSETPDIGWPTDQGQQGFTEIKPSADSKTIYVSSSMGSDSNNCTQPSTPCKSISAGFEKMRQGYPDHLYLKRGDTWKDQGLGQIKSGRSADEPTVVSYYGESGARPLLNASGKILQPKVCMKNVAFVGLHFRAYKMDPKDPEFTGNNHSGFTLLSSCENYLFEDNIFDYMEVVVQEFNGGAPKNFVFRRNIWTGNYYTESSFSQKTRPSNMYVAGIDGLLLEENVFDYGGWNPDVPGAGANMYNHNIYLQYESNGHSIKLKNNIITRGSSHGAQMRSGGVAEDNFFGRNSIGLLVANDSSYNRSTVPVQAINNVVSENVSMVKGQDACQGTNLCTPAVWGIEMKTNLEGPNYIYSGNVISSTIIDDKWKSFFDNLSIRAFSTENTSRLGGSGNILWSWSSETEGAGPNYTNPGRTLGDYYESIGGTNSFDDFMDVVLTRPVGTWDDKFSAKSINAYIKDGYKLR